MWNVIDILGPVFLVIALGAALRRGGFMNNAMLADANRLVYWVGLPAVLFHGMVAGEFTGQAWTALAVGTGGMLACAAVAYVAALIMRLDLRMTGSFVHVSFRGNLAYVGLAVIGNAFSASVGGKSTLAVAAALVGVLMLLYNVLAVIVLTAGRHKNLWATMKHMALQMAINPLIIACVAGALVGAARHVGAFEIPRLLDRTLTQVGSLASPVALLCVGGALVSTPLRGRIFAAAVASAIKVSVGTATGLMLAQWYGLTGDLCFVTLVFLACPTAVATYVLTEQLDGDGPLAAAGIVISTLMSFVSLAVVVAMT